MVGRKKYLSIGGKEILLNAVAQAIPAYAMSVFNMPKGIFKANTDELSGFWWGDTDDKRKMCCFSWWKLGVPKRDGGLGFRDLHSLILLY